jgi:hypothetical protein
MDDRLLRKEENNMDVTSYLLGKQAGGGGGTPTLQDKSITITENGTTSVTADAGYDGLGEVDITTNVSGGADLSEYFNTIIDNTFSITNPSMAFLIKKLPPLTINTEDCGTLFRNVGVAKIENLTFTKTVYATNQMFQNCNTTAVIDISTLDTTTIGSYSSMFNNCGIYCKQSDGAYADGIPYIYVKDADAQNWVLTASNGHPSTWSTNNVVIKQ